MIARISFVAGMAGIAGVSAVASILTICGIGWVLSVQFIHIAGKLETYGLPDPKKIEDCINGNHNHQDCTSYVSIVGKVETIWKQNQPIMITCSAIVIILAVVQLIVSTLISFSDPENTRKRAKAWMTSHFIIILILLVSILAAYFTRTGYGIETDVWYDLITSLREITKSLRKDIDIGPLTNLLKLSCPFFYLFSLANLLIIVTLFTLAIFVMHKYNKYETYE